jgi:hypothetical protein
MVRDTETGRLELDSFYRADTQQLLQARALRALTDSPMEFQRNHPDLYSAEADYHRNVGGISMRASVQGNTLFNRMLLVIDDEVYDRDDFAAVVEHLPVKRLEQMKA